MSVSQSVDDAWRGVLIPGRVLSTRWPDLQEHNGLSVGTRSGGKFVAGLRLVACVYPPGIESKWNPNIQCCSAGRSPGTGCRSTKRGSCHPVPRSRCSGR